MCSTELARLGDLRVQEHDWSTPDWPDYSAVILARVPTAPSNWAPTEHLDGFRPDELRKFADAINQVADRLERLYESGED